MQTQDTRITTLEPGQKPTAKQLIDEMLESITAAGAMGVFDRLLRCHQTRECQWANQQSDGRLGKPDTELPVFRWQGAPDLRIPLADKIVRWLRMLRMSVFNRGDAQIGPRRPAKAEENQSAVDLASIWQTSMEYFTAIGDWNLAKAYGLFNTCVPEFGYGLMLAEWQARRRLETCEVTMQTLTDALTEKLKEQMVEEALAAAEAAGQALDAEALMTPEMEGQIVQRVAELLNELLTPGAVLGDEQLDLVRAFDERMTDKTARQVVAQLRRAPGEPASYQAPKDDGGMVELEALVPWVNGLHDYALTGDGKGDWVAVVRHWSESKVIQRAEAEKWDKAGTAALLEKCRNKFFTELSAQGLQGVPNWALNGTGIGCVPDTAAMDKMPRWLVVYVYRQVTTKDGLPAVYKAVVNPHLPEHLLLWQATDLDRLPIVCETAEPCLYAMMSKGVPDIVVDKQNFIKDTMDSEGARGQLGSNPPLLRTAGTHVGIRPGIELYARKSGQTFDGSKFLEVPQIDMGALKMLEKAELLVEQYYFRSTDTAPEDRQMFVEEQIFASIRCYKELLRLLWTLVQENVTELQVSRLNGREVHLSAKRDQLAGEADISIGVHLDGYSKEGADKFMTVLERLMKADRAGAIDSNEAVAIAAQLLSPTYAKRLVVDSQVAAARVVDEQETRIAKIVAGVPVEYPERVSNPVLRMQVLQKWAAMPGNLQRAQADPLVGQMLQKEQEMLTFMDEQQNENPLIGRTGVKPNEPGAA